MFWYSGKPKYHTVTSTLYCHFHHVLEAHFFFWVPWILHLTLNLSGVKHISDSISQVQLGILDSTYLIRLFLWYFLKQGQLLTGYYLCSACQAAFLQFSWSALGWEILLLEVSDVQPWTSQQESSEIASQQLACFHRSAGSS